MSSRTSSSSGRIGVSGPLIRGGGGVEPPFPEAGTPFEGPYHRWRAMLSTGGLGRACTLRTLLLAAYRKVPTRNSDLSNWVRRSWPVRGFHRPSVQSARPVDLLFARTGGRPATLAL